MAFLWLVYFDDAILCAPASETDVSAGFNGNASDVTRLLTNIRSNNKRALFNNASIMNIHETLDRIMQRYALAMLYFSFQGYGWDNCSSDRNLISSNTTDECIGSEGQEVVRFLDSAHECEWFGVICSTNATGDIDVDAYYPVTHLELPSNNLHGYIPEDISLLYTLEVLDLWVFCNVYVFDVFLARLTTFYPSFLHSKLGETMNSLVLSLSVRLLQWTALVSAKQRGCILCL